MDGRKDNVKILASRLFCIGFFVLSFYFVMKYAIGVFLPFLLSYVVSLVIMPLSEKSAEKIKISKKICAAVFVTLIIGVIVTLAVVGASRLVREARELVSGGEGEFEGVRALFQAIRRPVEFIFKKFDIEGDTAFEKVVSGLEEKLFLATSGFLTKILSSIVSKAPSIFIAVAVTVLSTYYFCMDGRVIQEKIKKALPQKYRGSVTRTLSLGIVAMKKYGKAYLVLMLLTFVEIFIGLSILGIKYSFLLALVISAVDILPVLGAGSILIPWAVAVLLMGDTSLGLGLLILYGVLTVVRQISEPHVVGSTIGLHPLSALFSMYAGLKFFGFFGMIAGPAVAFVVSETVKGEGDRDGSTYGTPYDDKQNPAEKIKSRTQR